MTPDEVIAHLVARGWEKAGPTFPNRWLGMMQPMRRRLPDPPPEHPDDPPPPPRYEHDLVPLAADTEPQREALDRVVANHP